MAEDLRAYESTWPGLPIKYLVFACCDFIVFIDNQNDIDWQASDAFEKKEAELSKEERTKYHKAVNLAASIESIPCEDLEEKVILNFKRQIGEALVSNLHFDFTNAMNMLQLAKEYIIDRNADKSRYLYLKASAVTSAIAFILLVLVWLFRVQLKELIGEKVFILLLCLLIGALGAFLSIILRMGNTNLDYHASKKLHYMEGSMKVIAGMVSALLIGLCIKAGLLLPVFNKAESINIAILIGGLIAGSSERLAPSIIKKMENSKENKNESKNSNNN